MAQQVVFVWGKEFETNINQVDSEHRYLVEIINTLGNKLALQSTKLQDLTPIFTDLLEYAKYHFKNEETIMKNSGVDIRHAKEHLSAHKIFIKEVSQKYQNLNPENIKQEAKELLDFLVQWLTFHILGIDKNMSAQIRLIKSGYTPEKAYEEVSGVNHEQLDTLVKSFNGFFGVLMKYNEELLALKASLEEKVEQRTKELEEANKKLQHIAMTDLLTGLSNRRHMSDVLSECWNKFVSDNTPFSVIMLDLDNFKTINDNFGHDAGDKVLREFSETLKFGVRTDDVVCRNGGDEFLIICPKTDINGAKKLADKLYKKITKLHVECESGCWLGSSSIGVASAKADMKNKEELLKEADKAVYMVKNNGKNQVFSAS
ncbi:MULTISPECIES: GGDEF domain-containing protein [unclassified Campylobacter]|uniref:GGDEF domain-containing protein n=1 Tax=unclassified Campylobacter TaxID=2593542 RepID=UPI003D345357